MRAQFLILFCILICLASPQVHSSPHHAIATEFDVSKTTKIKGVVSKLDWANPHAHVTLEVKTGENTSELWDVELGSLGAIVVSGLSKDLLSPGSALTITGYPSRANASPDPKREAKLSLCATAVTLPDGRTATFVVGI
jgi:hypothetical protein